MNNELYNAVGAAAIISLLLQWVKNSSWFPWITTETAKLNRIVAVIVSGLASLGIHIVCSKVNHQCTLDWVSGTAILTGLWHWFVQASATHGWYKIVQPEQAK